jgi:hypothetical protein
MAGTRARHDGTDPFHGVWKMSELFADQVQITDGASNVDLIVRSSDGVQTIRLNGQHGNINLGATGHDGDLTLKSSDGVQTIHLNGEHGNIHLGGDGHDGDLTLKSSDGVQTIHLNGEHGNVHLGGDGHDGDLTLKSSDGVQTIHLNGEHGNIHLGGAGHDGDLRLKSSDEVETILLNGEHGNITLGGSGHDGDLSVLSSAGVETIRIDGNTGDIRLSGADCAELFRVADGHEAAPGTVLVMDDAAALRPCATAYDKRVAGVVSGAGDYRPGVILDSNREDGARVALMGKVFCKVDATAGPIQVGDLLTTSPTTGHAMKAEEAHRAFGSVIGKAMAPLPGGRGLIPVLVALQ